jgi:hypothetical protein
VFLFFNANFIFEIALRGSGEQVGRWWWLGQSEAEPQFTASEAFSTSPRSFRYGVAALWRVRSLLVPFRFCPLSHEPLPCTGQSPQSLTAKTRTTDCRCSPTDPASVGAMTGSYGHPSHRLAPHRPRVGGRNDWRLSRRLRAIIPSTDTGSEVARNAAGPLTGRASPIPYPASRIPHPISRILLGAVTSWQTDGNARVASSRFVDARLGSPRVGLKGDILLSCHPRIDPQSACSKK